MFATAVAEVTAVAFALRLLHLGESLADDEILSYIDIHGAGVRY